VILGPDNYNIKAISPIAGRAEQFIAVGLRVKDLDYARAYWIDTLGMTEYPMLSELATIPNASRSCLVGYSPDSTFLQLIEFNDKVDGSYCTAYHPRIVL
jgi:hypothetical protein